MLFFFFFYFNIQLDAFSTPKLKKDCENMKKEWMSSCAEIEKLRARNLGIEDRLESERESHRRALDQLREDRKPCQELFVFLFLFEKARKQYNALSAHIITYNF